MDEQNTQNPDPVTQPAGEATTPVIAESTTEQQTAHVEALAEIAPTSIEPPTAQLPPNEPLPNPALTGEATQSPSTPGAAPAQPEPVSASQPAPNPTGSVHPLDFSEETSRGLADRPHSEMGSPSRSSPAQAPVIVIQQNRIKDFFAKAAQAIQFRKQKKLTKIMALFLKKNHITNDEVEKLLHVSDATATRYLSQLEKQGKLKQTGRTGKGVTYIKI